MDLSYYSRTLLVRLDRLIGLRYKHSLAGDTGPRGLRLIDLSVYSTLIDLQDLGFKEEAVMLIKATRNSQGVSC